MMTVKSGTPQWSILASGLVIGGAVILAASMGIRQTLGLYLEPMVRDAATTAGIFGLAIAIQNLAWGVSQPLLGLLADRYGAAIVVMVAAPLYALGLMLMALGGPLGLQAGGGVLIGLAVSGSAFGVVLGAVSRGVAAEHRALAVTVVSAIGSAGTLGLAPLAQTLIASAGWQASLMSLAAFALLMIFPALAMRMRGPVTSPYSQTATQAVRGALQHIGFLATTLAFFACGFQLIFISTHLPNYLVFCGLPPTLGATAIGLIGLFNAVGTIIVGALGVRFGNGTILALVYLLRTMAILIFSVTTPTVETTLIFASVMGLLWLSVAPLVSGLITGWFGAGNFGMIFGLMFLSHQIGSFLGAWLGGLIFDLSGSYAIGWFVVVSVGALAFAVQIISQVMSRPNATPI